MAATQQISEWDAQGNPIQPQAATGATEWDAEGNPITASSPAKPTAPDLTSNKINPATGTGYGTYQMQAGNGKPVAIPYFNVPQAAKQGYSFADAPNRWRYNRDYSYATTGPGHEADYAASDRNAPKPLQVVGGVVKGIGSMAKPALDVVGAAAGVPQESIDQSLQGQTPLETAGKVGMIGAAAVPAAIAAPVGTIGGLAGGTAAATAANKVAQARNWSPRATAFATDAAALGGGVAGGEASEAFGRPIVARVAQGAGEGLQRAGGAIMNRTVGSRAADFKRGANPGRAYVDAAGKPAFSMEGLAGKAEGKLQDVGNQLGDVYRTATRSGQRIPVQTVRQAINSVINSARESASGPGVMANPEVYDQLRETFEPSFQQAEQDGGFTPYDLWQMRRNIDKNLNWADQSKLNLTKVQQQTSGAIGGVLEDALPATKPLNSQYQGLNNFRARAEQRANTQSPPLGNLASKATLAAGGAMLGSGHGTLGELAGAAALSAADSVPARSATATGLAAAGRGLSRFGRNLAEPAHSAGLADVAGDGEPNNVQRPSDNYSPKSTHEHVGQVLPPERFTSGARIHPLSRFFQQPLQLERDVIGNSGYGDIDVGSMAGIPHSEPSPSIITPAPDAMRQLPAQAGPEGTGVPEVEPRTAPPNAAGLRERSRPPLAPNPQPTPPGRTVVTPEGTAIPERKALPAPVKAPKSGKTVGIGDTVSVNGRTGRVTGVNAKTGRIQVEWQ